MKTKFTSVLLVFFHLMIWVVPVLIFELSPIPVTLGVFVTDDFDFFYPLYYGLFFNLLLFYGSIWLLMPRLLEKSGWFSALAGSIALFIVISFVEAGIDWYVLYIHDLYEDSIYFWEVLLGNLLLNLFILLMLLGYFFTERLIISEQLKSKLREEKLQLELDFLRWQVNPHFIFNTLNNLFGKAKRNKDNETAQYIEKLSGLMRYMIYETNTEKTTLKKEVDYLKNYLALQKLRFTEDDPVKIEFQTDLENDQVALPPALLIPFVENAFKYGISLKKSSFIHISLTANEKEVNFKVRNSKQQNMERTDSSGIGLKNVKRRLELLYGEQYTLSINDSNNDFNIRLKLPVL